MGEIGLVGPRGLVEHVAVQAPAVPLHLRTRGRVGVPVERELAVGRHLHVHPRGRVTRREAARDHGVEDRLVERGDHGTERPGEADLELQHVAGEPEDRRVGAGLVVGDHDEHVLVRLSPVYCTEVVSPPTESQPAKLVLA